MDATASESRNPFSALRAEIVGTLQAVGAVLLLAVGFGLAIRRIAGGLHEPLSAAGFLLVGLALAVISTMLRFGAPATMLRSGANLAQRGFVVLAPPLAVAVICISICLPGSSNIGLCGLWLIVVATEGAFCLFVRSRFRIGGPPQPTRSLDEQQQVEKKSPERLDAADVTATSQGLAANLLQQFHRGADKDTGEYCHGMIRATFVAAQRTDTLHLSFCPPFYSTPELHVEQTEGPDAQVKVTQLLPYGARLEVRLASAPETDVQAVLEFTALERGE
ncbi:MAG: hypothetical protein VB876_10480 [Pirellulales bacterium]